MLVKSQIQYLLLQLSYSTSGQSDNKFIIRKLLSNISLMFIKYPQTFQNPLEYLLSAFTSHSIGNQLNESIFMEIDNSLTLALLINFSSIIVEDICKLESSSNVHEILVTGKTFEITELIFKFLIISNNSGFNLAALECLVSWVTYTSLAEDRSNIRYTNFTTNSDQQLPTAVSFINNYIFQFLDINSPKSQDIELVNKAILVTTEILEINPRLFNLITRDTLKLRLFGQNEFGSSYTQLLISKEYSDELGMLVSLYVTFLRNDIIHLAKTLTSLESQHILNTLVNITSYNGIPIEEENISDIILPFWEELANVFIDDEEVFETIFEIDSSHKIEFETARYELFQKVCSIYWNKIHLPKDQSILVLIKSEFFHFRNNVADLFIVTYSLLKEPFYDILTKNVTSQLHQQPLNIIDLESSLFLLYKVTDDCSYLESQANVLLSFLSSIFQAGLISSISNCSSDDYFLYSSTINFLSSIPFYFKSDSGTSSLSEVFDLLFRILLNSSSGNSTLALHASKTILKICQECREKLVDLLPNLEQLLVQMLRNKSLDNVIRQRMVNSYTSIGRCIRDETSFGNIIKAELMEIQSLSLEVISSSQLPTNPEDVELKFDYALSLLTCVSEMGKGCQIPEEVDDFFTEDQKSLILMYWKDDLHSIKPLILSLLNEFSLNWKLGVNSPLITEKCCAVLKCGLSESIDGAFVFDHDVIVNYILLKFNQSIQSTPNGVSDLSYLFSLLESLVIVNPGTFTQQSMNEIISKIFTVHITTFQSDPDLVNCCINLFATILERRPLLIIYSQDFATYIIGFANKSILAKEQLVIKASLKFWLTFLTLKKGTQEDQQRVKSMMIESSNGQTFVNNLLFSFIEAPRSNLDYYYQVFRNLISKYSQHVKLWMNQAFKNINLQRSKAIEVKASDMFVNKLVLTRGMRTANNVCKSFWLEVNGLVEFNKQSF